MNARLIIDGDEFQKASRQALLATKRELSVAINARLAFLLMRLFILLPPQNPQAAREKIRKYMREEKGDINRVSPKTGKRIGINRILRRVHLIAQAKNKKAGNKGLYGAEMKKASAMLQRRAVGSVGYIKSGVARAVKRVQGHFAQFGKQGKKNTAANAALVTLADQYNIPSKARNNVAIHKGTKIAAKPATPGINPSAWANVSMGIADDQHSNVSRIVDEAFSRALRDETAEIYRHLTQSAQEAVEPFNAR